MQEKNDQTKEPIKPNLKHDNMEYAASTEGDDILDSDKETIQEIEDKEITTDELELLQNDDVDNLAAALNTAEIDSQADEDNFLHETDTEEELNDDNKDEQEENIR